MFKAIFCDSDESDDEDDSDVKKSREKNNPKEKQNDTFNTFPTINKAHESSVIKNKKDSSENNFKRQSRWDSNSSSSSSKEIKKLEDFKPIFRSRKKDNEKEVNMPNPARGVFAGIDLASLCQRSSTEENSSKNLKSNKDISSSDSEAEDQYGPALPAHLVNPNRMQTIQERPNVNPHSVNKSTKIYNKNDNKDKWIVKDSLQSSSKKSKKHKHKEKSKKKKDKKKKSKHKKKSKKYNKKYSSGSSESSSSDSD